MDTYIWDSQEMCVKPINVHQPYDFECECHNLPYIESGKENEEEEGESREPGEEVGFSPKRRVFVHLLGDALVDNYIRQPGDMLRSDSRIFDAPQKERGKANDKSYCAGENA